VLASGLFVGGLIHLGRLAQSDLQRQERYSIAFADIDCPPPPGQERADFLGEVQYLAGCPDRLSLLDDDLAEHLHQAFGRHPWVERVVQVETSLPRQVRVEVVYRTPVLGVAWLEGGHVPGGVGLLETSSGFGNNALVPGRTVDREGVLLPKRATWSGIPTLELHTRIKPPAGPAGTHWGDPNVEAAARVAAVLYPHRDRIDLTGLELRNGEWVLHTRSGSSVLWGQPPGRELPGEATAEQKVARLLNQSKGLEWLNRP
jgi:hypothetical protein